MKEKLKDDKFAKDLLFKFLSVLVIAIVALLMLNVMTQTKDGRSQIVDEDGGTEYWETMAGSAAAEEMRLKEILSSIKGVGEVNVMITYENTKTTGNLFDGTAAEGQKKVRGVIVTASGGADAVVKSNIMDAVTALFDIPVRNVRVFEKVEEGYQ